MSKKTTVSNGEWAKHLRPHGKRSFWKKDRKAGKLRALLDYCSALGRPAGPGKSHAG